MLSEDAEVLRLLKNGDSEAFDVIYDTYADLLASKLHKLVKLPNIVEELHQDVFIRFWNQRDTIDLNTNIKAYLLTIARNLIIDFYRKSAKDKALQIELAHHVEWSYNHIETFLSEKETRMIVEDIITKLPQQRQKVFRMVKIEGKSYAETADYFNVSLSTVKDHMAKSSDFVKQYVRDNHPEIFLFVAITIIF